MKRVNFDLIVIGSGDAGSEAALMAAKAGKKVALIEAEKWGGSSLNYTDVPQGALFHATQVMQKAIEGAKYGISSTNLRYNFPSLNNWRRVAMRRANANSKKPYEEAGIVCLHGRARFISKKEVSVGDKVYTAKKFLVATGASILDTGIKIADDVNYLLPENACDITRLPKSVFIVGAGSTGCELAQYYATLGVETVIADIAGRLLPREDEEVGQVVDTIFSKNKIRVLTQSRVIAVEKEGNFKRVVFMRGGQEKSVRIDEVLFCTGSAPNVDLGLENAGVKFDRNGIKVDKTMRTNVKHIFAAGDVVGGHSSTEKALLEARVAAMHMIQRSKLTADYNGLIRITNIHPEVACIGLTEDDCIKNDKKIAKIVLPLAAVQKSNTSDSRVGFIKVICDKNDRILGVALVAPHASVVIQELALAMRYDMTLEEVCSTPHVTNGWGEIIRLACEQLTYR